MSGDVISDFVFECAKQNIQSADDIAKEALRQIQEIDAKLLEADKLRPRRANLEKVYQHFGGSVQKALVRKRKPVVMHDAPADSLDSETKEVCKKILSHLENVGSATNRELMAVCGLSVEQDRIVYASIKWLHANGMVSKHETTRAISKGPRWVPTIE